MDGSEEESGWERSFTSRGPNAPACAVSSGSLRLPRANPPGGGSSRDAASTRKGRAAAAAAKAEEVDQGGLVSYTDHFDARRGGGSSADRRSSGSDHQHQQQHHHHRRISGGCERNCAGVEEGGEVSLREWLDRPERSVDLLECLHIFRQVVEMVSLAHSQGVVVSNVRPSCFVMSTFNRVSFIESASCSSSGTDSCGNAGVSDRKEAGNPRSASPSQPAETAPEGAFEQASETSCLRSCSVYVTRLPSVEGTTDRRKEEDGGREAREVGDSMRSFPLKQILLMEYNWYTSPEEAAGSSGSFAADIYRLGVLLFELFCSFSSLDEKLRTMSNLRHRVLPPPLLLKWPKEASFCLWLLHPLPSTRPKLSEVLQSEFLNEPRDSLEEREAAIKLREEIEDQELLLEFLLQLQQRKQETADKLHDMICCLSSDIEEVLKQYSTLKKKGNLYSEFENEEHSAVEKVDQPLFCPERVEDSVNSGSRKRVRQRLRGNHEDELELSEPLSEGLRSESQQKNQEIILSKSSRLMKNFKKLEAAYFSTRCRMIKPVSRNRNLAVGSLGRGSVAKTEGSSVDNLWPYKDVHSEGKQTEWINPFLEGLCKYLSFSKLRVRADLKQGDLLNSSNLVCSLGFDRDRELFATAGVNRKIKIFECDMVLNEDRDIHYPVVEMVSRSKLSSVCWNSYIKSHIASSDFEGAVQVWDVTRSQVFVEMREHERRVWSVDFSLADPTKLASGSDDGTVKLWNINQNGSTGTIKTKANVCSVQFPPDSGRSLAIGSADHRIYLYDLRNLRVPWCTLAGHTKTVSYVKFVDSSTLVSASTDNSLKLWDLSTSTSRVLDSPLQTFTGHTNVKNFVGLSISDGYIATGSETNEVFVYHKAFPMPVLSFKFNSADPISGHEVDDGVQFISCVCWRGQSSTLVAANSTGNIKLLEMV